MYLFTFRWTFNPACLTKVSSSSTSSTPQASQHHLTARTSNTSGPPFLFSAARVGAARQPEAPPSNFVIGDLVQVCGDMEKIKALQRNHGEWADSMLAVRAINTLPFLSVILPVYKIY